MSAKDTHSLETTLFTSDKNNDIDYHVHIYFIDTIIKSGSLLLGKCQNDKDMQTEKQHFLERQEQSPKSRTKNERNLMMIDHIAYQDFLKKTLQSRYPSHSETRSTGSTGLQNSRILTPMLERREHVQCQCHA